MSWIKKLVVFFVDDIKQDYKTLQEISNGTYKPPHSWKDMIRIDPAKILKECWVWFLIIILAFLCGMFFSAQHWQDECNTYIQEEILPGCKTASTNYSIPPSFVFNNTLSSSFPDASKQDMQNPHWSTILYQKRLA